MSSNNDIPLSQQRRYGTGQYDDTDDDGGGPTGGDDDAPTHIPGTGGGTGAEGSTDDDGGGNGGGGGDGGGGPTGGDDDAPTHIPGTGGGTGAEGTTDDDDGGGGDGGPTGGDDDAPTHVPGTGGGTGAEGTTDDGTDTGDEYIPGYGGGDYAEGTPGAGGDDPLGGGTVGGGDDYRPGYGGSDYAEPSVPDPQEPGDPVNVVDTGGGRITESQFEQIQDETEYDVDPGDIQMGEGGDFRYTPGFLAEQGMQYEGDVPEGQPVEVVGSGDGEITQSQFQQFQTATDRDISPSDLRVVDGEVKFSQAFQEDVAGEQRVEALESATSQAEANLEEQFGRDLNPGEDFFVRETDEGYDVQLSDELIAEQAGGQVETQTGRDLFSGIAEATSGTVGALEAEEIGQAIDEETARELGLEQGEDFTVDVEAGEPTVEVTEDFREQQVANQLGVAASTIEEGEDYTRTDDGGIELTAVGRQTGIEAQAIEEGEVDVSGGDGTRVPSTVPAIGGAEIGGGEQTIDIQNPDQQLEFDDEGNIVNVRRFRETEAAEQAGREALAETEIPFTDIQLGSGVSGFAFDSRQFLEDAGDVSTDVGAAAFEGVGVGSIPSTVPVVGGAEFGGGDVQVGLEPAAEVVGDVTGMAQESAEFYAFGGADEAADVRQATGDIVRGEDAEQQSNIAEGVGEKLALGGADIVRAGVELPETISMGADVVGQGAAFTAENPSQAPAAGVGAAAGLGEQIITQTINNPIRSTGALVGSAGIMGGAARVSSRAGLASRAAIQPGEELLGYGGYGVTRRVAGQRAADTAFPNQEPLIFSEEAAIRAGQRVSGGLRSVAGEAGSRIRSGVETVRRETPISVEVDPNQGFVEVGDEVPAQTRRAIREGPTQVAQRTAQAGGGAVDELMDRTSRFAGTGEARFQREFLPGTGGGMFETDISAGVRDRLPSFDRRPDAELDDDVATAADEPPISSQGVVGDPTDVTTGTESGGGYLDELFEEGETDLADEPAIRSQRVPDPEDITPPRETATETATEDPAIRMEGYDPLFIEAGGPTPRFTPRETETEASGPGLFQRSRQEITAARFEARERIGTVGSALGDLTDITIRVGDPDRPSITRTEGTEIEAADEPPIRSQTDDPLNLGDTEETPLEGGAAPGGGGGGGGGGELLMEGETGVAQETVIQRGEMEGRMEAPEPAEFETGTERDTVRTQPFDDSATDPMFDIGVDDVQRPTVDPQTAQETSIGTGQEMSTDQRIGLDSETDVFSEIETETETETETELEQELELETETETELELEMETETEQEVESELFPEDDEQATAFGGGFSAEDETFASGIASAEDVLGDSGWGS